MSKPSNLSASLKKSWGSAPVAEPTGFNLPDGNYVVKLTEFTFVKSKKGSLMACWTLAVVGGKFKDKTFKKFANLQTDMNVSYFKADLVALGVDVDDVDADTEESLIADVTKRMKKLIGKAIEIRAYSKTVDGDTRHNTAFVALSPGDIEEEEEEEAEESDDEDGEDDADDSEEEDEEDEDDEEEEAPKKAAPKKSKAPSRADVLAMTKDEIAAFVKKSGERAIRGFDVMNTKETRAALLKRLGL